MDRLSVPALTRVLLTLCVVLSSGVFWARAATAADTKGNAGGATQGLKQYVLPDHTASVMLPPTWKVTQTGVAQIIAQGPGGEIAMFGILVPAHDGKTTNVTPTVLNQPYAADAEDKFTQSLTWVRTRNGKGAVPIHFVSQSPVQAPPAFGHCTNMKALLGAQGQLAVESDMCSMPVNSTGDYRNFFKVVGVSAAQAGQEKAELEAILGSYQLNPTALQQAQKSGAPASASASASSGATSKGATPSGAASNGAALTWSQAIAQVNAMKAASAVTTARANALNRQTLISQRASLNAANNFDMGVLRGDTPVYAVGQSQPLFWIGD